MAPLSIAKIPYLLDGRLAQALPLVDIAWQGKKFAVPPCKIWIRPTCKAGGLVDLEKGEYGYSRRVGVYIIDVYAPNNLDPADAWGVAELLEKEFRRVCIGGIQTEDPDSANMGVEKDNDSFRVRVAALSRQLPLRE